MEFHTKILPLDQSKKLLGAIQKPGKQGRWITLCKKADGVSCEVDLEDMALDGLNAVTLPKYCSSINILGKKIVRRNALPESLFMCGDDWTMWEGGQIRFINIGYISKRLKIPVSIRLTHDNEGRYCGREWNFTSELSLGGGRHAHYVDYLPDFDPEKWKIEDAEVIPKLSEYQREYGFPSGGEKELLNTIGYSGSISYILDPENTFLQKYEQLLRVICAEDADSDVIVTANEDVGGASTVYNGPQNIRNECQRVLDFALNSEYDKFSGYYSTLKLETWAAREKRRKKWKKPILQELGILEFKDVGEAEVKVIIEKEGYIFVLDFLAEDAFGFAETPLFKKAVWHSGDE